MMKLKNKIKANLYVIITYLENKIYIIKIWGLFPVNNSQGRKKLESKLGRNEIRVSCKNRENVKSFNLFLII